MKAQQYNNHKTVVKRARALVMIFALSLLSVGAFAQGPDDPPGGLDPDAPIDGGLSLLVAAGVGYGVKKVRDKKKQGKEQNEVSEK